jgi:hypothetical protein
MRSTVTHGMTAARVAAERSELWLPGALSWLAFLGWLPLVAIVPGPPDEAGLAFFGAGLVTSSAWPLNAVLLGLGLVVVVMVGFALGALGEAALRIELAPSPSRGLWPLVRRLVAVRLLAAGPAAVGIVALLLGLAAVAPGEFRSPDIGGSLAIRILRAVAPLLVAAIVLLVASQALSAAGERTGSTSGTAFERLVAGIRRLRDRPAAALSVVLATFGVRLAYLIGAAILLSVLWSPIGAVLDAGFGLDAGTALLLVGFVAVWLCLVLGGGAMQVWASIWWTLELTAARFMRTENRAAGPGSGDSAGARAR